MRALLALLCAGSAFAQVSHVAWTVTGVLNDPLTVEPIIRNWTVR